jgi:translation initiation factor 5B
VRPFAQVGTPVCVLQKDFTDIGRIASIRFNEKAVDHAKKGQKVTIKVWHIVVD